MIKKDQLRLHIYIDITINHFSVERLCFLCFCVGQSFTESRGGESEFAAPTRLLVRHCLVVRVGGLWFGNRHAFTCPVRFSTPHDCSSPFIALM